MLRKFTKIWKTFSNIKIWDLKYFFRKFSNLKNIKKILIFKIEENLIAKKIKEIRNYLKILKLKQKII